MNFNQIHSINMSSKLESIMRKAGAILGDYFGTDLIHTDKKSQGFFTDADLASEKYLIEQLSGLMPEAAIIAEESGSLHSSKQATDYCWVIDPLDGTTNFAHGLDYFCISVALTYKDKPIVGAIFRPAGDEFFYAQQGGGAFLNGQPIAVSRERAFGKSLIALGLPYGHDKRVPLIAVANNIASSTFAIRHFGAAALDLAYVACGRLDGLFFSHLRWWDVAAGIILIEEAGGVITDFNGDLIGPAYVSCMAGSRPIYDSLSSCIKKINMS